MKEKVNKLKPVFLNIKPAMCIILIIFGSLYLLGSTGLLIRSVRESDHQNSVSDVATYDFHTINRHVIDNTVLKITVYLEKRDALQIDPDDYSNKLKAGLEGLEKGDEVRFVYDPESGFLLKLEGDELIYEKDADIPDIFLIILMLASLSALSVGTAALILRIRNRKQSAVEKAETPIAVKEKKDPPADPAPRQTCPYTYRIGLITEKSRWVIIECNEENSRSDAAIFAELIKKITMKLNRGVYIGNILPVGEQRYKIKNDPLSLIYQYDTLFGIVFEYGEGVDKKDLTDFLINVAEISPSDG